MSMEPDPVIQLLLKRKSVRAYEKREIGEEARDQIIQATLRAPTAGNMMLYSVIEIRDQAIKDTLAKTCDNQPFIATAPLVLLFLADYQRWCDYFLVSGVEDLAHHRGEPVRGPQEGDLFISFCDALIAAHTAVIAAESLGIGSCYIGDILENYEVHRDILNLPRYALPVCLVCFGYPTAQQKERPQTPRFDKRFIVFENRYKRLVGDDLAEMFRDREERMAKSGAKAECAANVGQHIYLHKFNADFAKEMARSVKAMLRSWTGEDQGK
jgi:nitroreductase